MTRRLRILVTATTVAAIGAVVTAAPASATPVTPGASGYAGAGFTGSGTMQAGLTLSGTLGSLLNGIIGPIVSSALDPLVATLQGSATGIVDAALGGSSTFHATTPVDQGGPAPGTFPGDLPAGLPSPCSASSTTQPCYQGATSAISAAPLITLGATTLAGYTQEVPSTTLAANPILGRAQSAGTSVSVLPAISGLTNPMISTGTVDSTAVCPNSGSTSPSADATATNVQLLGGQVTFSVGSGQIAGLTVFGTSYASLSRLPVVTAGGVTVQPYGTAIKVTLPLTLAQIAAGVGLPSSVTSTLTGYAVSGTALNLSLIVGPNVTITKRSAQAWGLGLGVDLSGSLNFNLLNLVGAQVSVPTGITADNFGNILDLRLGYTACTTGTSGSGANKAVPPALV